MHPRLRDTEHGTYGVRRKPDDDGRPLAPESLCARAGARKLQWQLEWSSLFLSDGGSNVLVRIHHSPITYASY